MTHNRFGMILTALILCGTMIFTQTAGPVRAESGGETVQSSESSGGSSSSSDSGSSGGGGSSSDSGSSGGGGSSSDSGSSGGSSSSSDSGSSGGDSSEISTSSDKTENGSEAASSNSAGENTGKESTTSNGNAGTKETAVSTDAVSSTETSAASEDSTELKPTTIKKIVKDDSGGRDYSDREIVSSGNFSFTIVSVSRNEEEINKKLKKLEKKKKKINKRIDKLNAMLVQDHTASYEVRSVCDLIKETDSEKDGFILTGCVRDLAYLPREDVPDGLDDKLAHLAKTSGNQALKEWTETYTTEYLPQTVMIDEVLNEDTESGNEGAPLYSRADPILNTIDRYCQVAVEADKDMIIEARESLVDVKEHIKILKEVKAENTIQLDSRLTDYKDVIPDETVEFLNAVVAKEGAPYVWGASGPDSFDCSGLVSYGLRACKAAGAGFRWTSYDFVNRLKAIPFSEALPGDLVWKHGHIAIYIDENTVFEAPYRGARVRFTSCNVSSRFSRVLRWWSKED